MLLTRFDKISTCSINNKAESSSGKVLDTKIEEICFSNKNALSDYISSRKDSSFVDCWEWREIIENIYGLEHFWYVAKKNDKINGFLGLTLSNHPIFGRYLVTAPFASQGGFYADSEEVFLALIAKAGELQDQIRARYTLIRHMDKKWDLPAGWQNDHSYATYRLDLGKGFNSFSKENITGSLRNKINKFRKHDDLRIMFGGFELIEDFWKVISRSMKELGSPYHSKLYLETIAGYMGSKAEFVLSKTGDGRVIGGGLVISHLDKMEILHMNALKEYKVMNVADFLYWSTIRECYRRKVHSINMGRSLVESGNEKYKMKWKPIRNDLYYSYRLTPNMKAPKLNQRNPRLKYAINAWQRMPLFVANLLGPRLISGLL